MSGALRFVLSSIVLASTALPAQDPPLRAPASTALDGRAYAVDLSHDVRFQGAQAGASIVREARLRLSLTASGAPLRTMSVRIDTARGSVTTPHDRQVLDLRAHQGMSHVATFADSGRPLTWTSVPRDLVMGDFGRVPLGSVLEAVIAPLPSSAVRPGSTWERTVARATIHGQHALAHDERLRFTVERIDGGGATRVVHVRFVATAGDGAPPDHSSSGTMRVGADGVLHELRVEHRGTGTWDFNGEQLRFVQVDSLHVVLRDAPRGARR